MDGLILEGRFSVLDLQQAGPAAVIAVDMVLTAREEWYLTRYQLWLRKSVEKQKEDYIKSRPLFEKNNTLNEYESFKEYYFNALDKCETDKQLLDLYIERCSLVWAQVN